LDCKERQALEIHAQNVTLEDQRKHIAILDKALKNAQEKVTRKENEVRPLNRQSLHSDTLTFQCQQLARAADRNAELQQALQASVADKQERDEAHKRVKAQLEMEIAQLKMQLAKVRVFSSFTIMERIY
jgi:angiomotin like 1